MPSRFDKYRMRDNQTQLAEGYFNPVWRDIDGRLVALESEREDWEARVQEVIDFGLVRIQDALGPALTEAQQALEELQAGIAQIPNIATQEYVASAVEAHSQPSGDPHSNYLNETRHAAIAGNPHGTTASQVGAEPALGLPSQDGMILSSSSGGARTWVSMGTWGYFEKGTPDSPLFNKVSPTSVTLLQQVRVMIHNRLITFPVGLAVQFPALVAGTDYFVYLCTDGTARATTSHETYPDGYTTYTARLVGGLHYGLVDPSTTLVSGGFNTAGTPGIGSFIWTDAWLNQIKGFNLHSFWDLRWRPSANVPFGAMALVMMPGGGGYCWADIYLRDKAAWIGAATSRAGATIATSAAPPKIAFMYGGGGTYYDTLNWFRAVESLSDHGKRLPRHEEFMAAVLGVTEGTKAASAPVTTARVSGLTSRFGLEQAAGALMVWGSEKAGTSSANNRDSNGRGYIAACDLYGFLLGGHAGETTAAYCGSRATRLALLTDNPTNVSVRGFADNLKLL